MAELRAHFLHRDAVFRMPMRFFRAALEFGEQRGSFDKSIRLHLVPDFFRQRALLGLGRRPELLENFGHVQGGRASHQLALASPHCPTIPREIFKRLRQIGRPANRLATPTPGRQFHHAFRWRPAGESISTPAQTTGTLLPWN